MLYLRADKPFTVNLTIFFIFYRLTNAVCRILINKGKNMKRMLLKLLKINLRYLANNRIDGIEIADIPTTWKEELI